MASGGKRGAGDRVLEGRHVIGLFILMLLFSGVFFTLGYVVGRNQFEGQVRAEPVFPFHTTADASHAAKPGAAAGVSSGSSAPNAKPGNSGTAANTPAFSEWEFYHAGAAKTEPDHLVKPSAAPPPKTVPVASKTNIGAPLIPGGAYVLQVAALTQESEALALAQNLQKKKFPAFVLNPGADRFYHVQVGPYADAQSAGIARKGLEGAGFKAILKK